jgi:hypothetical protein
MSDKRKKKVKINDLKARPLTAEEKAATKGGVVSRPGPIFQPPQGVTTPRADRWTTDNGTDVD